MGEARGRRGRSLAGAANARSYRIKGGGRIVIVQEEGTCWGGEQREEDRLSARRANLCRLIWSPFFLPLVRPPLNLDFQ